jgi:hypothetical protein
VKFAVSLVATEATLEDGTPLQRGQTIDLTPEQREHPFNARLVVENQLIPVNERTAAKTIEDAQATLDNPPALPAPEPDVVPPPAPGGTQEGGS